MTTRGTSAVPQPQDHLKRTYLSFFSASMFSLSIRRDFTRKRHHSSHESSPYRVRTNPCKLASAGNLSNRDAIASRQFALVHQLVCAANKRIGSIPCAQHGTAD